MVVGPELVNAGGSSEEELREKLREESRKIIEERLKGSLDRKNVIPISREDTPEDLGRSPNPTPPPEVPQPQPPRRGWRTLWGLFARVVTLPGESEFPSFERERELQDLQTDETRELDANQSILEVFEEAKRRLLILGEPGSGKTTELLTLAEKLAIEAQDPNKPIPVIFELSAWRGEPMLDWLAEQMRGQYNLNLTLCQDWLKRDKVVLLLDGLDELEGERIGAAIAAIDALQQDYKHQPDMAICCRIRDYRSAIAKLQEGRQQGQTLPLRGIDRAVRLCELSEKQIENYLRRRNVPHLWQDLQGKPGFLALAKSPMLLNLMPIAYPDGLPENAPAAPETCQSLYGVTRKL